MGAASARKMGTTMAMSMCMSMCAEKRIFPYTAGPPEVIQNMRNMPRVQDTVRNQGQVSPRLWRRMTQLR